jgi:hypothetical protein
VNLDGGDSKWAHSRAPVRINCDDSVGAHGNAPGDAPVNLDGGDSKWAHSRAPVRRSARSLGSLIGGYKTIVTIRINQIRGSTGAPVWQRNYHDHIIRNEAELSRIREYIRNNPLRWDIDKENQ